MSEDLKAAQARIAELEAWKEQEMQVMSPLMDYARGVCTGPLGCSLADWLVQDHKQLRAELAAIKAREPVGFAITDDDTGKLLPHAAFFMDRVKAEKLAALTGGCSVAALYAAPVSEATP